MSQMRNEAWRNHPVVMPNSARKHSVADTHVSVCSAGGAHRWRIDEPSAGKALLHGKCGKCGRDRDDFKTSSDWLTSRELLERDFRGTR